MKRHKVENFSLFKQFLFPDFSFCIWQTIMYKFILISLILLTGYSFLRMLSFVLNIKYYIIFLYYYLTTIAALFIFLIWNYQNYLGKFIRLVDFKAIYETYMVVKRQNKVLASYLEKNLDNYVSISNHNRFRIHFKWKIPFIILILFILFFSFGSLFSFFEYGKIVYKMVPYEIKEVLTMQSIVEKALDQLDKESDQYKYLSKLYEEVKANYSRHGINQKEFLDRLNQILQQSTSLSKSKENQYNSQASSSASSQPDSLNKTNEKKDDKRVQSRSFARKYMEQEKENEKSQTEKKSSSITQTENVKQSFLDFLKTELFHPDSEKGKGIPGYQAQDLKSSASKSTDFSSILQSIYSNSSEFSYSLSNQLTESQKIEIFNYLIKHFNLDSNNINFDEELFYKLIILYLEQIQKMGN